MAPSQELPARQSVEDSWVTKSILEWGAAGFDLEAAKESRGLGLISMEERLKLLNGTLSVGMGMSQV